MLEIVRSMEKTYNYEVGNELKIKHTDAEGTGKCFSALWIKPEVRRTGLLLLGHNIDIPPQLDLVAMPSHYFLSVVPGRAMVAGLV